MAAALPLDLANQLPLGLPQALLADPDNPELLQQWQQATERCRVQAVALKQARRSMERGRSDCRKPCWLIRAIWYWLEDRQDRRSIIH
jgi:hypothetical protein